MKKKLSFTAILSIVMALSLLAGCSDPAADSKPAAQENTNSTAQEEQSEAPAVKVAWICDGVLTDGGWNTDGYEGMQRLAEEYNLDVSYQENVPQTDVQDVLRNYANEGYDLVLSNEQYHCEPMAEIAPEFPDVVFGAVNGYVSADNMIAVTGDLWQHNYLAGVMSGMVTKSNKIGLITFSTDSNSALTYLASYGAGAKSVNPDVEVIHVATGSFSDLAAGKEMATSLIDQGCDVIYCNSGDCNQTVMELCVEKGVYTVSAIVDRNWLDDEYVLGSTINLPSTMLRIIVEGYLDGSLTGSSTPIVGGIKEGIEEFKVNDALRGKMDQSVFDALDHATEEIKAGNVTVELP